ncbi:hypothetical protein GQ457_02G022530 [Hibiscus cannabinus]
MEGNGRRVTTRPSNWETGIEEPTAFLVCGCGFSSAITKSWSNKNPGRKFFGCKNHGIVVHHDCRFFSWFDPLLTPRARVVLLGLLKRIRANEVQRRKERICWFIGFNCCCVLVHQKMRVFCL